MAKKSEQDYNYYIYGLLAGVICVLAIFIVNSLLVLNLAEKYPDKISFGPSLFTQNKIIQVPILIYHYVEFVKDPNDTIRKSLDIIPPIFEAQVATLKEAGYTFLTPSDINLILEGKRTIPAKPVILSFDDGYEDFYTDVMPILKKYEAHAVQYIITGLVDTPNYLKSEQIKEIKKSNLVELACHSVSHPAMASLDEVSAAYQIETCKKDLFDKFGVNAVSFAYPYGSHDTFLFPILAKAGFKNSVTTDPGTQISNENIYNIPRLRAGIRTQEELTIYLEGEVTASKVPQLVEKVQAASGE